jgi:rRNA maturation endonuclease Nob1
MPKHEEEFNDPTRFKVCPRCSESFSEDHNFCNECGTPLIEIPCDCGKSLNAHDRFCPACGSDVVSSIRTTCAKAMLETTQ